MPGHDYLLRLARRILRTALDLDSFYFFERQFLTGAIVELGRAGRFVIRDSLGVLQCATVLQIGRNSGGPKCMTARGVGKRGRFRTALDHVKHVESRHWSVAQPVGLAQFTEKWALLVAADSSGGNPGVEVLLKTGMAGHFVALTAFFMQAKPPTLPMLKVISDFHGDRRTDPGEAVDHRPDQGPVAQPNQTISFNCIEQLACFLRREHRGLAPFDHVLRAAHRGCRVDVQDAAGGQIIKQLANSGQVLLDCRFACRRTELFDVGGYANRLDVCQIEPTAVAPIEEVLYRARTPSGYCGCGYWR